MYAINTRVYLSKKAWIRGVLCGKHAYIANWLPCKYFVSVWDHL